MKTRIAILTASIACAAIAYGVAYNITSTRESFALLLVTPSDDVLVMDYDLTIDDCARVLVAFDMRALATDSRVLCERQPIDLERISPTQN